VYIQKELEKAAMIRTVIVYGYTDTTMLYGKPGTHDTFSVRSRTRVDFSKTDTIGILSKTMAGKWPMKDQQVLLVADSLNKVALLAVKVKEVYRFWDPNSIPFANSIIIFEKKKGFHPLPLCHNISHIRLDNCDDGCLVEVSVVKEK